jgi:hypothetical protein
MKWKQVLFVAWEVIGALFIFAALAVVVVMVLAAAGCGKIEPPRWEMQIRGDAFWQYQDAPGSYYLQGFGDREIRMDGPNPRCGLVTYLSAFNPPDTAWADTTHTVIDSIKTWPDPPELTVFLVEITGTITGVGADILKTATLDTTYQVVKLCLK